MSVIWSRPTAPDPTRSERRGESRFDTELEVRYLILDETGSSRRSTGITVNLSAGGMLIYDALEYAPPGTPVELSVHWPVRLGQVCPLHLLVNGRIVRREGGFFALRADRYEFRTYGSQGFHDDSEPKRFSFDG